jgi:hypothetical protein
MLLRCPAASLKALLAYGQQLDKRGWPYFALVTRIGFEAQLAYPSLTFTPERWLDEDELAKVMAAQKDDLVLTITALRKDPSAGTGVAPAEEPEEEDAFARMEKAAAPAPATPPKRTRKPRAAATVDEVAAAVQAEPEPAAEPQAEAGPPAAVRKGFGGKPKANGAAAAPVAQAAPEEDDDGGLGDEALDELESVLAGFDDGDEEGDEA